MSWAQRWQRVSFLDIAYTTYRRDRLHNWALWRGPMPWQGRNLVDERLKFVARMLDGEKMAAVCREFGISRKTGYKIFNRYKSCGLEGLQDRPRRPYRHANQQPFQVERTILRIKRERPSWGAPKIREKIIRAYPTIKPPAKSTVHAVLDRHGLVRRRKPRRYRAKGQRYRISSDPTGCGVPTIRVNSIWGIASTVIR